MPCGSGCALATCCRGEHRKSDLSIWLLRDFAASYLKETASPFCRDGVATETFSPKRTQHLWVQAIKLNVARRQ